MLGAALGLAKTYKLWIMAAAVAGVLGSGWLYVRSAENAKARVGVLEERLATSESNLQANVAAFDVCWAANVRNAQSAAHQMERAREAELRLTELTVNADRDVEDVEREEVEMRSANLACPAITSEFRSVFGDS